MTGEEDNAREKGNARTLYIVLAILSVGALIGMAGLYVFVFDATSRKSFEAELGKGLIYIFTVAVIGSIVKLLVDDHQRRLREANEARAQAKKREQRLQEFRMDKVRRLVGVTNILRRAPVLIDAHRSAETYNEQMRAIVDAGLELRLIRHETDAIGRDPNPAFPHWSYIEGEISKMETYMKWLVDDFRDLSKKLNPLQRKAESESELDREELQQEVWDIIGNSPSVRDLLQEVDAKSPATRYSREYLKAYENALHDMIQSSFDVQRSERNGEKSMDTRPKHLMISGLGDCELHRKSARERNEEYLHVREISEASRAFETSEFEIVYVDASPVYRGTEVKPVDARAKRLTWVEQMGRDNPRSLFVIVRYSDESDEWEPLLDDWVGKNLPNVVFQDRRLDRSEAISDSEYLSDIVHAWESLNNP
jgi:hypothetical protein